MIQPENNSPDILSEVAITVDSEKFFEKWKRSFISDEVWPFPLSFSCCSNELRNFRGVHLPPNEFDFKRTPEESDLLVIGGTVTHKMVPFLKSVYDRMPNHKMVMAVGACASSGGPYWTQSVVQGISQVFPVDVYLPGCPPSPASIIDAMNLIKERINRRVSSRDQLQWSLNV